MKTFLYLDDSRSIEAPSGYLLVTVRSFSAFVNYIIIEGLPDVISFDHDLSEEHTQDYLSDENFMLPDSEIHLSYDKYVEKTGYDAAKWLVDYVIKNELKMPFCRVHSMNVVGAENIVKYLNNYSKIHEDYDCCKKNFVTF